MKTSLFTLFLITITSFTAFAQSNDENDDGGFEKGNIMISGGISFASIKQEDNGDTNRFTFTSSRIFCLR